MNNSYPPAYTNKEHTFFGRKFYLDERAYVSNTETEELVRSCLHHCQQVAHIANPLILDVGT